MHCLNIWVSTSEYMFILRLGDPLPEGVASMLLRGSAGAERHTIRRFFGDGHSSGSVLNIRTEAKMTRLPSKAVSPRPFG